MMPSAAGALPPSEKQLPDGVAQARGIESNNWPCGLARAGQQKKHDTSIEKGRIPWRAMSAAASVSPDNLCCDGAAVPRYAAWHDQRCGRLRSYSADQRPPLHVHQKTAQAVQVMDCKAAAFNFTPL